MTTRKVVQPGPRPKQDSPDRPIKIDGKNYVLRFGLRAQSALKDHWGIQADPVGTENRKSGDEKLNERLGVLETEDTVTIVWAAMRSHHPELTHEDVLELLDASGVDGLTEILGDLIGASSAPADQDGGKKKAETPGPASR